MRKALEFEITAQPAAANFGSISRAMAASTRQRSSSARPQAPPATRHLGDPLRQRRVQPPLRGLAVSLAARPVAGRKPGDFEPRMVLEQLDVTLADHSGRAQDADGYLFFMILDTFSIREDCFIAAAVGLPG